MKYIEPTLFHPHVSCHRHKCILTIDLLIIVLCSERLGTNHHLHKSVAKPELEPRVLGSQ